MCAHQGAVYKCDSNLNSSGFLCNCMSQLKFCNLSVTPFWKLLSSIYCAKDKYSNHILGEEQLLLLLNYIKDNKWEEWDGLGMWRTWVRRGECIGSWWGNRREGNHWGDLGVDGWIILGWISRRWDVGIWTGLGWPRIEMGGGRLWVR